MNARRLDVTATITADGRSRGDGEVHFIDNQVDPATGTIRLKARFANPDAFFWPGQFVRVRLVLRTIPGALLVPDEAISQGAKGAAVFVADANGQAELRPVRTAESLEGRTRVTEGLSPGESVVVEGQNKLKPGTPIKAVTW